MTCVDIEALAAEYIDGTLARDVRAAVEQHLSVCENCAAFLADAAEGASLLAKLPEIEPPQELVTLIAFHAPVGRTRDPLASPPSWFSRMVTRWFQPVLQPKFAMSMAMTIVSFAMLQRCTGIEVQHIQAADLTPSHVAQGIEDKVIRTRDRAVKYYENIRLVYDVETRLRRMEREREAAAEAERLSRRSRTSSLNGKSSAASQPAQQHAQETSK
jgi:hypothetical protein